MSTAPPSGVRTVSEDGTGRRGGGVFIAFTLGLLVLSSLISGCATKGDLRDLRNAATEQQAQLNVLIAEIRALQDSLEIQSNTEVNTRGGLARELREILDQLSQLMALTGQVQRSVALLAPRAPADRGRVLPATRPANPDSVAAFLGVEGADPAAAEATYQAALVQFRRGSLNTARRGFEGFLASYTDHELAPSAQWFLADILEQENLLDEAIQAFLQIGELYPTADRVPTALYRIGAIYAMQENVDEAVRYLERVVNTYPDSDAADLAQELLRELR